VKCSTRRFSDVLGDAVLPDVPAGLSFADYTTKRDPALEALSLVRGNSGPTAKTMSPALRTEDR